MSVQSSVAAHYNQIKQKSKQQRAQSAIIGLKSFNNWIKSVLIDEYMCENASIMDLCCGKGGDLKKFQVANIKYYFGTDHASQSLCDAIDRYNRSYRPFPASFVEANAHVAKLTDAMTKETAFDLVSCQFALHYCFESERTCRRFLSNAATRLLPGGYFIATFPDANVLVHLLRESNNGSFGNSIYRVTFEAPSALYSSFPCENPFGIRYTFDLTDAIDHCPEYLVHMPTLTSLCAEYDLELVRHGSLHSLFLNKYTDDKYYELAQLMGVLNNPNKPDAHAGVQQQEWEALYVYMYAVFRKRTSADCSLARQQGQQKGEKEEEEEEEEVPMELLSPLQQQTRAERDAARAKLANRLYGRGEGIPAQVKQRKTNQRLEPSDIIKL